MCNGFVLISHSNQSLPDTSNCETVMLISRHIRLLFCKSSFGLSNKASLLISYSYHNSSQLCCASEVKEESSEDNDGAVEAIGYAYNTVEKKKGLYRPKHTLEEQIAYMNSKGMSFFSSYKILFLFQTNSYQFNGNLRFF